jgi:uncharacterized membrane protein YfcA
MSPGIAGLLFGAGVCGGIANAIAGGATLITFPAMLAAGLPALVANASNSIAVIPGALVGALADRAKWPPLDRRFLILLLASLIGGSLGAWLLISTSESSFTQLVPALIGGATLLFASAPRIQAAAARHPAALAGTTAAGPALIGGAAVYGGYFGAGLGVMLMSVLSMTSTGEMRSLNATKNLLSCTVAFPTVVIFVARGLVSWPETLVMLVGAATGGFCGARLARVIPPLVMRRIVVGVGAAMTVVYAVRYWS